MENKEKQHALDFVNWLMEECTLETDESTGDNVLWSYHGEDYSNEGIYEYFAAFQKRTSIPPMINNEQDRSLLQKVILLLDSQLVESDYTSDYNRGRTDALHRLRTEIKNRFRHQFLA